MPAIRSAAIAAALLAGIVLADEVAPGWGEALGAGILGSVLISGAFVLHRAPRPQPNGPHRPGDLLPILRALPLLMLLSGVVAVGFSDMGLRGAARRGAVLVMFESRIATIEGSVIAEPRPAGRATRFTVRADKVEGRPAREAIALRVFGRVPSLHLGDRVRFDAKVEALDPSDPFDISLSRRGVVAEGVIVAGSFDLLGPSRTPVVAASNHVRNRMRMLAEAALGISDASVVLGLTIGDDRSIPRSVEDHFRATGLSHLLAVSGANVAILLGALIIVMRGAHASRRAQIAAGLGTVTFFGFVAGWEPSVLRAVVMASLGLLAFLLGRRYDARHGLVVAFAGLLAVDPYLLWSIGFQLSFAATAGILVLTPRIVDRLGRLPRWAAEATGVSVAAQTAVAPLLALHFGRVSLIALPANLVAFPLVAPITVLGLAAGTLGLVLSPAGVILMKAAGLFSRLLRWVAAAFAEIPGASWAVPKPGAAGIVAAYLLIGAVVVWLAGRRRVAVGAAAAAAAVALLAGAAAATSAPPEGIRMIFFDVGQGDSALIESAAGVRVLIDGGPDPDQVSSVLRRRGIRRIDLVVFSHDHADHINGLWAVLERVEVRAAVEPGVAGTSIGRRRSKIQPEEVGDGDGFVVGDLFIDVLGPTDPLRAAASDGFAAERGEGSLLNDASVVVRVGWAGGCALFPGDLEEAGQQALVEVHGPQIECTILKAPHHGSARLDATFVATVDPEWMVVSVGPNPFGHPSVRALALFENAGARVLRTDRLDDVVLEIGGGSRVRLVDGSPR